ncbi:MAG TPA: orotidine-5'-phosphate decarboxylase [Gemmatimonadaceae bacterium]|nr:orotidine-5'-phosphate decarboxylase [Gemmatimonadaceae bacterium]
MKTAGKDTPVTPIVALDVPTVESALIIVSAIGDLCRFYKVGSELFTGTGPTVVKSLREHGCEVFLDLKWHDIPNTIRGAARSAARIGARLVTVHATGGKAMMEAAVRGADEGATGGMKTKVFAVTLLTSLDAARVSEAWGRPTIVVRDEVHRLADQAHAAGVAGIVCGGDEAAEVRAAYGDALEILVPGVRLAGTASNDQLRVTTPERAAEAGANYIVIGRTVTGAPVVRDAMRQVLRALAQPA